MSRATVRNQLLLNDGAGNKIPVATATWLGSWVNIDEHRRLNYTIGITSATGAVGDAGGYTGTLVVQGTDELAQCYGATGTPEAGGQSRPGVNGFTGALFPQTIPSGTFAVTNATTRFSLSFTDVGFAFVRLAFNMTGTGVAVGGTACGSGLWNIFLTAKNT